MSTEPSLLSPVPEPLPAGPAPLPATPTLPDVRTAAAPRPGTIACAVCANQVDTFTTREVNGQPVCRTCNAQIHEELSTERSSPSWALAVIGGLVGSVIGAVVWAAIALIGNVEIGYVAILVGFLAGLGVKIGAGGARSRQLQILAVVLAVAGLFFAKYAMVAGVVAREADISPFSPLIASIFTEALGEMLSPFDILWLIFAIGAAWKVPAPSTVDVY
jgi:hypothetical protein